MTTIAFDGRILAADSQATAGNIKTFDAVKVRIVEIAQEGSHKGEKHYVACCGDMASARAFCDWYRDQAGSVYPKLEEDFHALAIAPHGIAEYWDRLPYGVAAHAPVAIGSGKQIALGAMAAGKNAIEAVEIAKQHDCFTGGEVKHWEVKFDPTP